MDLRKKLGDTEAVRRFIETTNCAKLLIAAVDMKRGSPAPLALEPRRTRALQMMIRTGVCTLAMARLLRQLSPSALDFSSRRRIPKERSKQSEGYKDCLSLRRRSL